VSAQESEVLRGMSNGKLARHQYGQAQPLPAAPVLLTAQQYLVDLRAITGGRCLGGPAAGLAAQPEVLEMLKYQKRPERTSPRRSKPIS